MVGWIASIAALVIGAFLFGLLIGCSGWNHLKVVLAERQELIKCYKQQVDFLRVELAQEQDRNKDKEWFTP